MSEEAVQLKIDPDDLTIEEIEAIEDRLRLSIEKVRAGKLTRALVALKLEQGGTPWHDAWEQAGKVKMKSLNQAESPLASETPEEESPESADS
jgi:hypothetical protein